MFDNKRLKELEIKVDLILNHLDLIFIPHLEKREPGTVEIKDTKEIEKKIEMICPFYHKDDSMKKMREDKKNGRVCIICGEPLTKGQRKVCGKKECREKFALEYVYKKKKRRKTKKSKRVCKDCGGEVEGSKTYCMTCGTKRRYASMRRFEKKRQVKKAEEDKRKQEEHKKMFN